MMFMNMFRRADEPEEPLSREEARKRLRYYLRHNHHANLFLTWELKYPWPNRENEEIIEEFLNLLVKMGLVK